MTEKARYNLKDVLLLENYHENDEIMLLRDNPLQLIDKGYDYIDKCEYNRAFKVFTAGAQVDKKDPDILNGLGICLCEMGLLKEAKQVLDYAIHIHPDDPVIFANMAGVLWEQSDYDSAVYYYNRAIEIDSEIEETFFNLINLYIETGSLFMALITCTRFIEKFPESEEALGLRDDIILNLGIAFI
jgi:tetratricopeptide (TPR) repeat protein